MGFEVKAHQEGWYYAQRHKKQEVKKTKGNKGRHIKQIIIKGEKNDLK